MPYLQIDRAGISFGHPGSATEVLRDVNLRIDKGEYVSVIGHSGCGKTTLLNIVAGLLRASTGRVLLEGREVSAPGPDRAVVFQNHALLPWLTVRENVGLAVDKVFGGSKTRAERRGTVHHKPRPARMNRHPRQGAPGNSGGTKQGGGTPPAV